MQDFITLCDGYKLDHRRQYPDKTQFVLSNWTPRSSRFKDQDFAVFFGLQYFTQAYLVELANATFFSRPVNEVTEKYQRRLDGYFGPNDIGVEHIRELHKLGYIPLEFMALPEGTRVPLRVPMFTIENTHHDFFWVTNYIETLLSSVIWQPCTSATTALRYRQLLTFWAQCTGADENFVDWQGHDFSFRGMGGPEASALSGAGHLLSFTGTDSLPAIELLERYYGSEGMIGGSVPATEHSVMCAGGQESELQTFQRIMKLYPTGIVSVVSDTWDLWHVIGNILPQLKNQVMARNGKLVIRPDSGNPVDIICGDQNAPEGSMARKGVVAALWDIFGGTTTNAGFGVLDPHIGVIYGDSITEQRADLICKRLAGKGLASSNVVFGIGSYTYQYTTRDVYGFAMKATWAQVDGQDNQLFKDPKTDSGEKRSARGRVAVVRGSNGRLQLVDGLSFLTQHELPEEGLLRLVWRNGETIKHQSLDDIRATLRKGD